MKLTEQERIKLAKKFTIEEKHYAITYFSGRSKNVNTFGIIFIIFLGFASNSFLNYNFVGGFLFTLPTIFFCYHCWKESNELENEINDYLLKGGKK